MFGDNPIRPPEKGDGTQLDIQEIFKTLQGEGPFTGVPAIFIRLGGCNLSCSFCDTEFESFKAEPLTAILEKVDTLSGYQTNWTHKLVVITGGEPLRQPIELLSEQLLSKNYRVQIETNGTLYRPLHKDVHIVCSPKNQGKGYFPIREDLLPHIQAFKFLISANDPLYHEVTEVGQSRYNIPVYVQPLDSYNEKTNQENLAYTLALADKDGYYLSLQTHKLLGLP